MGVPLMRHQPQKQETRRHFTPTGSLDSDEGMRETEPPSDPSQPPAFGGLCHRPCRLTLELPSLSLAPLQQAGRQRTRQR